MIENYKKDQFGVVHQIDHNPYTYNKEYVTHYNEYNDLTRKMGFLRIGYLTGAIGPVNSILDVGYGNGAFLEAASTLAKTVGGYDVFDNPCLPDGCTTVTDITSDTWDVITFFDSLEHFESLDFIKDLKCNYIVISAPWCHYPDDDTWFTNWKHRKPDEHLHHFNDLSLEALMNYYGYSKVCSSNIEDAIRTPTESTPNILTAIFKNTQ